MYNFASVFHGIRFKVKRLIVGMTVNFFCLYSMPLFKWLEIRRFVDICSLKCSLGQINLVLLSTYSYLCI